MAPEIESDARPTPPEKPLPMDCCDSGCEVCVFDAYADALAEHEEKLAQWLRRQPDAR